MLARCLLVAAILSAGLPATASAAKKRFRGETAQSRMVTVVVNESGRVQRMPPALRGTWTFAAA
jgi:hypothetical protein